MKKLISKGMVSNRVLINQYHHTLQIL